MGPENLELSIAVVLFFSALIFYFSEKTKLPSMPLLLLLGIFFSKGLLGKYVSISDVPSEQILLIGQSMLMFFMGLEIPFRVLKNVDKSAMLIPTMLSLMNILMVFGVCTLLGLPIEHRITYSLMISLSSVVVSAELTYKFKKLYIKEINIIQSAVIFEDLISLASLFVLSAYVSVRCGVLTAKNFPYLLFMVPMMVAVYLIFRKLRVSLENEVLVLLTTGVLFLVSGFMEELKLTAIIGSFMVGLCIANTKVLGRIKELLLSVKTFFTTMYFVYLGSITNLKYVLASAGMIALVLTIVLLMSFTYFVIIMYAFTFFNGRALMLLLSALLSRGEDTVIFATYGYLYLGMSEVISVAVVFIIIMNSVSILLLVLMERINKYYQIMIPRWVREPCYIIAKCIKNSLLKHYSYKNIPFYRHPQRTFSIGIWTLIGVITLMSMMIVLLWGKYTLIAFLITLISSVLTWWIIHQHLKKNLAKSLYYEYGERAGVVTKICTWAVPSFITIYIENYVFVIGTLKYIPVLAFPIAVIFFMLLLTLISFVYYKMSLKR